MAHSKATNVIEFYQLVSTLKFVIRSGWQRWNVKKYRLESIAEHVYGACMLAIVMYSEYEYEIDIKKVVMMLAIHELEEVIISDITPFDGISHEEKEKIGHEAVSKILAPLRKGADYQDLILEFDAHITPESKFAFMCDKLECDLMSFYYDDDHSCTFDLACESIRTNPALIKLHKNGLTSMSDFFYSYDRAHQNYDKNFLEVLDKVRKK